MQLTQGLKQIIPEGFVWRIPFGPLAGVRLQFDPSLPGKTWIGLAERKNFQTLRRALEQGGYFKRGVVVCDIGANVGIYSLWFSKIFSACDPFIYAIEANPATFRKLTDNLALNSAHSVVAMDVACSDKKGVLDFFLAPNHHTSSLVQSWAHPLTSNAGEKIRVRSVSLDDIFFGDELKPSPDVIKMDIEGGGVWALPGARKCIEAKRPLIYVESHTPAEDAAIGQVIREYDYRAFRLSDRKWVTEPQETHPHPDGVWGNLLLIPNSIYSGSAVPKSE